MIKLNSVDVKIQSKAFFRFIHDDGKHFFISFT